MTAIVLIGVMADRPALTLRTLAIAAFGVLLLAPQSVVHPSFQMSFAATLALIAAYERGLPWMTAGADTSTGRPRRAVGRPRDRRAHSCVVGCRTGDNALRSLPFPSARALWRDRQSARHADRVGLGDADGPARPDRHPVRLRRPVLAADGRRHRLDDRGRAVRGASAGRGRADGGVRRRVRCCSAPAGSCVLCLLKTPLRWSGGALVVAASLWAVRAPLPDVLVSADGAALAVRGADGRLADPSHRPRRLCRQGMARRRRRRAAARRQDAGAGLPLRRVRLHREARRRQARLAGARRPTPSRRTAGVRRSSSRAASCPASARRW